MSAPDPEAIAAARAEAVEQLAPLTQGIAGVLDNLHGAGLAIPQPAQDAARVLAALGMALAANAQGQPAPPEAAALLDLPRPAMPLCRDCGGFRTHAEWCEL